MDQSDGAFLVRGVLERTTRHNIRGDMDLSVRELGEGIDSIKVFKISKEHQQKGNLASPITPDSTPTLLELKEMKESVLDTLLGQVRKLQEEKLRVQEALDYVMQAKLRVDCAECVHRVGQCLTKAMVDRLGKKLQSTHEELRVLLSNGAFKHRQKFKRQCGTYFELLLHHSSKPNGKIDTFMCEVEQQIMQKFQHIRGFPKTSLELRQMVTYFVHEAKVGRDKESHIGMIKDKDLRERALKQIECHLGTLQTAEFNRISPLVEAGICIFRFGLPGMEDDGDDDGDGDGDGEGDGDGDGGADQDEQKHNPLTKPVISPSVKVHSKVTFFVNKELKLNQVIAVYGFNEKLGSGLPENAVAMKSSDGFSWKHAIKLPFGVLQYGFVIMQKKKVTKWTATGAIFGPFSWDINTSKATIEHDLQGIENEGHSDGGAGGQETML